MTAYLIVDAGGGALLPLNDLTSIDIKKSGLDTNYQFFISQDSDPLLQEHIRLTRSYRNSLKMSLEVLTTISPTTNEPILTRNGVSQADLDELPKVATEAFQSWRKTPLADRQAIVKKFLKLLGDKKDELAEEITVQMGRPLRFTGVEVTTAIKRAEYLLKVSDEVLKDTEGEAEKGFKRFIRKDPVGPILVIFAWNVRDPAPGRAVKRCHPW